MRGNLVTLMVRFPGHFLISELLPLPITPRSSAYPPTLFTDTAAITAFRFMVKFPSLVWCVQELTLLLENGTAVPINPALATTGRGENSCGEGLRPFRELEDDPAGAGWVLYGCLDTILLSCLKHNSTIRWSKIGTLNSLL